MSDTVRLEARNRADDEDYVNAIEVPVSDADAIRIQWERQYGHVSTPSDEESDDSLSDLFR